MPKPNINGKAKHIADKKPASVAWVSVSATEYTQYPSNEDNTSIIRDKTTLIFISSKVEELKQ